jgi:hypothetical protein
MRKEIKRAAVETERTNITTGGVLGVVACLAASESHIPRARKRLVPLGRWGRDGEREHQSTHEAT